MSPTTKTAGSHPRATPGSLFSPPNNQAILLEKLNVRKSTPDSEALANSDDDVDHRQEMANHSITIQRSGRRSSWLNDTSQAPLLPVRKASFAGSMSPTASHPSTPSAETGATTWGPHSNSSSVIGRGSTSTASPLTWGTGIWNTERKEPPSRLTEVLPSPTSTEVPPNLGSSYFSTDSGRGQSSPASREPVTNPHIPFAIPLEPTPKTYRSQSYSVGQLDPETLGGMIMTSSLGRTRSVIPHSAPHHRPSRPSMLSEMNDGSGLDKVNEDDGDDENENSDGYPHRNGDAFARAAQQQQLADAKTIEMLTREHSMLRPQHWQNSRLRPRTSTSSAYGLGVSYSLHEPVPEESDYAIDELDENGTGDDLSGNKRTIQRRMSEFAAASGPIRTPFAGLENRKLESIRKAHWQSSLDFAGLDGLAQSRRHSFADVPTRHASICSVGDGAFSHERAAAAATAAVQESQPSHNFTPAPAQTGSFLHQPSAISPRSMDPLVGSRPPPYFNGAAPPVSAAASPYNHHRTGVPLSYTLPARFSNNRAVSPHRNLYNLGMAQPRQNQLLYVVLFKCARADVFYIQEGTGLSVKPGDLVIVEADRGTDLGTVAMGNVDWHQAKEYKEHYAEEQYKWLMMYSQNAAAAQDSMGTGSIAMPNALPGSAIGGMGPPSQHHMPEPNSGELKPKLIKRLAQNHEIQGLREKEGQEAKAKRVCMQKVKEHGLNMEILDAEFQMDWKKLTFYYFADSYINFNSLVTDLFKIYKTRIWMSAINPASFASPALGLQAPSGIGPGAVNTKREGVSANSDRRHNIAHGSQLAHPPPPPSSTVSTISASPPPPRTFVNSSVMHSFGNGQQHPNSLAPSFTAPAYPYESYGPVASAGPGRPGGLLPYSTGITTSGEGFAPPFTPVDYQSSRSPFLPGTLRAPLQPRGTSPLASPNEWMASFQGLSLNSR